MSDDEIIQPPIEPSELDKDPGFSPDLSEQAEVQPSGLLDHESAIEAEEQPLPEFISEPEHELEPEIPTTTEEKPLPPSWLRRTVRWVLGLIVVFGLGVLFAVFVLYQPTARSLDQTRMERDAAQQQVDQLESRIAELSALETENAALQEEIQSSQLHILILSAQADISAARYALVQEEPSRAKVLLTNTPETFQELAELVGPAQIEDIQLMQRRFELVLAELDEDPVQAQADLGTLANSLIELENVFFVGP